MDGAALNGSSLILLNIFCCFSIVTSAQKCPLAGYRRCIQRNSFHSEHYSDQPMKTKNQFDDVLVVCYFSRDVDDEKNEKRATRSEKEKRE